MEMSPNVDEQFNQGFAEVVLQKTGHARVDADRGTPAPLEAALGQKLNPDGASINVVARVSASPRT